jgi:DNA polymerase (family X)
MLKLQIMPFHNREIAKILDEIADLLAIKGENEFRVRSYRNAARTINGLTETVSKKAADKAWVRSIPGIGESMAGKIAEIASTGSSSQLQELRREVPAALVEVMKLGQMGPSRTKKVNENLDIKTIDELKKAAEDGRLASLAGFGKKTAGNLLREINEYHNRSGSQRFSLHEAGEIIRPLLDYLRREIDDIIVAGSFRRRKETVGDIDILGTARNPARAMDHFAGYEEVERVITRGDAGSSVRLHSGLKVDLRIFKKGSLGAASLYFTGSRAHTIALRKLGQQKNYKINEYGIYEDDRRIAGKSEKEMYRKLGLAFIEPELREDLGEIEASVSGTLPDLITIADIKGDLQSHTNATDGRYTLREMADAAEKRGYEYLAITDHSKRVAMAKGLDEKRLIAQLEMIDELNNTMKNLRVLKSIEVDILEDGSLDLPDEILRELDLVVCAIHYGMKLPAGKQTRRIIKAMESPFCNILAHPTGRKIGVRAACEFDMEEVMRQAIQSGCFLEINSHPDRLDLNDQHIRMARDMGLKMAVSTDAHSIDHLQYMKYGVAQARRGWLAKDDVINTRPWKELKKLLIKK